MTQEATAATTTFNILKWVRARRLQWLGHILRLPEGRLVRTAVEQIHSSRAEGNILMDVPECTWQDLLKAAGKRDAWKAKVKEIKKQAGPHIHEEEKKHCQRSTGRSTGTSPSQTLRHRANPSKCKPESQTISHRHGSSAEKAYRARGQHGREENVQRTNPASSTTRQQG